MTGENEEFPAQIAQVALSVKPIDDGSLAYLFKDYIDDGIREQIIDFGNAIGNEQW